MRCVSLRPCTLGVFSDRGGGFSALETGYCTPLLLTPTQEVSEALLMHSHQLRG